MQIQRQIHAGLYTNSTRTPGGQPFNIEAGEASIRTQYKQAIAAARRTILIENQALPVPEIATTLESALQRGVQVALLAPPTPNPMSTPPATTPNTPNSSRAWKPSANTKTSPCSASPAQTHAAPAPTSTSTPS